MPLAVGDVVELSFRGTLFSQRILNILHYVVNATASGTVESNLNDFANQVAGGGGSVPGLLAHLLDCVGSQYTCEAIRAQRVYPLRSVYQEAVSGDVGQHADPCTTGNVALSFLKKTFQPGRIGIGRMQLAGVPQTSYVGGSFDPVYLSGPVGDLRSDLSSSFQTTTNVVTYVPCIFNPTFPPNFYSSVYDFIPQSTVRTMHRRTVRVGE